MAQSPHGIDPQPDPLAGGPGRPESLQIGSVLAGRYRILERLGDGAMGSVYLGEHLRIGRKDAIKVLRDSLADDAEAMARFVRGARSVSRIRHANVCTIYDFSDTAEGVQFLAMEYIPGQTLKDLLIGTGALPIERVLSITSQAAGALQAAHDAGIVHRDLKPANIMLMPAPDGTDIVKVVDFDIAKAEDDGGETEVTRFGYVVGTPEYMSPEQLTGEKLDGRSDVYSLALVVFRMLTGVLPFPVENTREMLIGRLTMTPLTLAEAAPEHNFPPALQSVLDWALQRNADDRAPSTNAFARALGDVVNAATPVRAAGIAPDLLSRRTPPATRVMGPAPLTVDQLHFTDTDSAPPRPGKKLVVGAVATAVIVASALGVWLLRDNSPAPDSSLTQPTAGLDSSLAQQPDTTSGGVTDNSGPRPPGDSAPRQTEPEPTVSAPVAEDRTPPLVDAASAIQRQFVETFKYPVGGATPPTAVMQAIRDTAVQGFNQANSTEHKHKAAYTIAMALYHLGRFPEGLSWAKRALDLCPGCAGYQNLVDNYGRRQSP